MKLIYSGNMVHLLCISMSGLYNPIRMIKGCRSLRAFNRLCWQMKRVVLIAIHFYWHEFHGFFMNEKKTKTIETKKVKTQLRTKDSIETSAVFNIPLLSRDEHRFFQYKPSVQKWSLIWTHRFCSTVRLVHSCKKFQTTIHKLCSVSLVNFIFCKYNPMDSAS